MKPILIQTSDQKEVISWIWGYIELDALGYPHAIKTNRVEIKENKVPPIPSYAECDKSLDVFPPFLPVYDENGPFGNTLYFLHFDSFELHASILMEKPITLWRTFKHNFQYGSWTPVQSLIRTMDEDRINVLEVNYRETKKQVAGFETAYLEQMKLWEVKNSKSITIDTTWLTERDQLVDVKNFEPSYPFIPIKNPLTAEQRSMVKNSGFEFDLSTLKSSAPSPEDYCDALNAVLKGDVNKSLKNYHEALLLRDHVSFSQIRKLARKGKDTDNIIYQTDMRPIRERPTMGDFRNFILSVLYAELDCYSVNKNKVEIQIISTPEARCLVESNKKKARQSLSEVALVIYNVLLSETLCSYWNHIHFYFEDGFSFSIQEAMQGILRNEEAYWEIREDLNVIIENNLNAVLQRFLRVNKRLFHLENQTIDISCETYLIYLRCFKEDFALYENLTDIENTLGLLLHSTDFRQIQVRRELEKLFSLEQPLSNLDDTICKQLEKLRFVRLQSRLTTIFLNSNYTNEQKIILSKELIDSFESLKFVMEIYFEHDVSENFNFDLDWRTFFTKQILLRTQLTDLNQLKEFFHQYPILCDTYIFELCSLIACMDGDIPAVLCKESKQYIQNIRTNERLMEVLKALLAVPLEERISAVEVVLSQYSNDITIKNFETFYSIYPLIREEDRLSLFNLLLREISDYDENAQKNFLMDIFSLEVIPFRKLFKENEFFKVLINQILNSNYSLLLVIFNESPSTRGNNFLTFLNSLGYMPEERCKIYTHLFLPLNCKQDSDLTKFCSALGNLLSEDPLHKVSQQELFSLFSFDVVKLKDIIQKKLYEALMERNRKIIRSILNSTHSEHIADEKVVSSLKAFDHFFSSSIGAVRNLSLSNIFCNQQVCILNEVVDIVNDEGFNKLVEHVSIPQWSAIINSTIPLTFTQHESKRKNWFSFLSRNLLNDINSLDDFIHFASRLMEWRKEKTLNSVEGTNELFKYFASPEKFSSFIQTHEDIEKVLSFLIRESRAKHTHIEETDMYFSRLFITLPGYAVFALCKPLLKNQPKWTTYQEFPDEELSMQAAHMLSRYCHRNNTTIRDTKDYMNRLEGLRKHLWNCIKDNVMNFLTRYGDAGEIVKKEILHLEKKRYSWFNAYGAETKSLDIFSAVFNLPEGLSQKNFEQHLYHGNLGQVISKPRLPTGSSSYGKKLIQQSLKAQPCLMFGERQEKQALLGENYRPNI